MDSNKYINRMVESYQQFFRCKPHADYQSPLEPGDHPELDVSEFLSEEDTQIYQSLVGGMQWAISIGRWDIQTAVMTLSRFGAAHRKGHLLCMHQVYGYLLKF